MKARSRFARLLLLGCLSGVAGARAELKWSALTQNLVADPAKREVAATFSFVNTGKTPVRIVQLVPSCGCTTAALEKRDYAPGEGGRIEVVVHYEGDASHLQQSVAVVTDERKNERHLLSVDITVPGRPKMFERIEVNPQALEWARGASPRAQVISLRIPRTNDEIRPVSAAGESDEFAVLLRQPDPKDARAYELVVTPRRVDRPAQTTIVIHTNSQTFRPDWLPEIIYRVSATVK